MAYSLFQRRSSLSGQAAQINLVSFANSTVDNGDFSIQNTTSSLRSFASDQSESIDIVAILTLKLEVLNQERDVKGAKVSEKLAVLENSLKENLADQADIKQERGRGCCTPSRKSKRKNDYLELIMPLKEAESAIKVKMAQHHAELSLIEDRVKELEHQLKKLSKCKSDKSKKRVSIKAAVFLAEYQSKEERTELLSRIYQTAKNHKNPLVTESEIRCQVQANLNTDSTTALDIKIAQTKAICENHVKTITLLKEHFTAIDKQKAVKANKSLCCKKKTDSETFEQLHIEKVRAKVQKAGKATVAAFNATKLELMQLELNKDRLVKLEEKLLKAESKPDPEKNHEVINDYKALILALQNNLPDPDFLSAQANSNQETSTSHYFLEFDANKRERRTTARPAFSTQGVNRAKKIKKSAATFSTKNIEIEQHHCFSGLKVQLSKSNNPSHINAVEHHHQMKEFLKHMEAMSPSDAIVNCSGLYKGHVVVTFMTPDGKYHTTDACDHRSSLNQCAKDCKSGNPKRSEIYHWKSDTPLEAANTHARYLASRFTGVNVFVEQHAVKLNGMDTENMLRYVNDKWGEYHFNKLTNNCSRYAANLLKAGVPASHTPKNYVHDRPLQMPSNTLALAREISAYLSFETSTRL